MVEDIVCENPEGYCWIYTQTPLEEAKRVILESGLMEIWADDPYCFRSIQSIPFAWIRAQWGLGEKNNEEFYPGSASAIRLELQGSHGVDPREHAYCREVIGHLVPRLEDPKLRCVMTGKEMPLEDFL